MVSVALKAVGVLGEEVPTGPLLSIIRTSIRACVSIRSIGSISSIGSIIIISSSRIISISILEQQARHAHMLPPHPDAERLINKKKKNNTNTSNNKNIHMYMCIYDMHILYIHR